VVLVVMEQQLPETACQVQPVAHLPSHQVPHRYLQAVAVVAVLARFGLKVQRVPLVLQPSKT
jgi:hypothetical protein